ncbi:MAG: fumarate hydratase [Elusimicrobia bacterium GWA2_56_46]|nr:MAG: fumarate hydratase [Elusimicrobia bacterium GWA2_56_46]OGR55213.1 MAG: fumarate hydratase [Elusimicrobia bacterium GWC2_56_31]HBW23712.1 fumarate hydratase [Elusimicrobiota bacterium]
MTDNKSKFKYQEMFELKKTKTKYRKLTKDGVKVIKAGGREILEVAPEALVRLTREAIRDVSFLLRPAHQQQVARIFSDSEASDNDKFIAYCMLENAAISARFELPFCQDTGTATVIAKKGERVWTRSDDAELISKGVWEAYTTENLRYSQTVPLDMYKEKNSGNNLPAQIDLYAKQGMEYEFLFVTKGGGSANKTMLYQETKAALTPEKLKPFLIEKMRSLGTAACPPYHIVFVIGGTSAEMCLKTVKLASTGYLDALPGSGNEGGRAFRDRSLEKELLEASYKLGYGAQFGGKYFAHDVRVIRLPRHGASVPIGMGVSCSADRNILARIDRNGLWLEELERNPGRLIPKEIRARFSSCAACVSIDLSRPMKEITAELSKHPVGTRLSLNGKIVVARDLAHAKFRELMDQGKPLPQYLKDHPVYYAGPAKQPKNKPSGSFGPTTAGRMDSYVELLQSKGASLVMLAKGNRSQAVTGACKKYGGFYLGSPGGPAALLAERNIKKVETLDYPELGMEAVWAIEVEDFPAFILVDDKGNDFFTGNK